MVIFGVGIVVTPAAGQVINEDAKLLASNGQAGDRFGVAIALGDGLVGVGAHLNMENGEFAGSAYVYSAESGQQLFKLLPSDGSIFDEFGFSIAIGSGIVAVGAHRDDSFAGAGGSAYLFSASTGAELFKISPETPSVIAHFGWSIAIDNGIVAVGAYGDDFGAIHSGSVYLFNAFTGSQLAKLAPSDGAFEDWFGQSVAIDNGIVAIGAHHDDDLGTSSGSAYLFSTSGSQIRKLLPNDGAAGDRFGKSIAIDDGIVAVGAYRDDDFGSRSGSAYLFDVATGAQLFKLVPDDSAAGDRFGRSISISDGVVAVGAYYDDNLETDSGSVYLFDVATGLQIAKLLPEVGGDTDRFGRSVAIDAGVIAVGAYLDDDFGADSGSAYLFNDELDSDGDGLQDRWEIAGIPYIGGGGFDLLYVLPGADPLHKDLYVEVDSMLGIGMSSAAVSLVEAAFANAPHSNPDGIDGITLHVIRDEGNLPFVPVWQTDGCWPLDFDAVRSSWYGTSAERAVSDPVALLEAKAKAFRYCIVAERSGPVSIGGCGQRPGDNIVMYTGIRNNDEQQAVIFMHELGHNLNLQHGGGDSVNGKPNYPSIMNYVMAYRARWSRTFWRLDYSRQDGNGFTTLDEVALDETVGIGTPGGIYSNNFMPYGVNILNGMGNVVRSVTYVKLDGSPVDFGSLDSSEFQDGIADVNAQQDLNFVSSAPNVPPGIPSSSSFGEWLTPYNDWANVGLELAASIGAGAPAPSFSSDELSDDGRDWVDANFEIPPGVCQADLVNDGVLNFFDVSAFLLAYGAQDAVADFEFDGVWNFFDVSAFLQAYGAGCP